MPHALLLILSLLLASCRADADTLRLRVQDVVDGDSFKARDASGQPREVRISGIDAPEGRQAHGLEAKRALEQLIEGKDVVVEIVDVDQYRRIVARVYREKQDAGLMQLEQGNAWVYPWAEGLPRDAKNRYAAAERSAKQGRRGLWAAPEPKAPWMWRRESRNGVAPSASTPPTGNASVAVIANRNSKLYHLPGCPGYAATSAKNRVAFPSIEAAERAGYRRAGNCP